ncbi:conserved hypothetical protein [Nostocoides japonicum T1-X7]|uniref:SIS domain-containing protein n=1 Tax=Nostocoides japonicum T1-X7 TaxID=1194083 RepID=A0A077LZU2_9MICO|nr:SIS domain-containing protein [Tetrasphaera japonica]CCH78392.1 conserved hypothetical protein [Tetrasphaera japonica T1-X7]
MIDESRLDDPQSVAEIDRRDVLRTLALAGANVRRTRVLAHESGVDRVAGGDRPRAVLVAAVGASAVVGDVLDLLAEAGSPVSVATRRNVPLPGWVGPLDLVIAISQSGRAPGPLALAAEAGRRGASLLTVGAVDSPLADVAARYRGVHVDPEGGDATSRGSLWSLLVPALLGAAAAGVVEPIDDLLDEVADALDTKAEECRPSSESFVNPAKILAVGLGETVPVVLGDGALTGVVAARAAAMVSRTARIPTTCGELPDAASQVVAAFDGPYGTGAVDGRVDDIFADPFLDAPARPRLGLLMLREPLPDPVTEADAARHNLAQAVADSAQEAGVKVWEQVAPGGPPLVRLADQIALVDYTATYLAIGLGLDPAGSAHVADLRDRTR